MATVLDRDPVALRSALDHRYAVLDEVLAGRRRAVVYPAARMGREAAAGLRQMGANVVALGDRDPTLQGRRIDDLPVVGPGDIAAHHQTDVILIASTMYDSAIRESLAELGCRSIVPVGYLNLRLPDVFRSREYEGAWRAITDPANRADIAAAYSLMADERSREVFIAKLGYYLSLDKGRIDAIRSDSPIYFDPSVYELGTEEVVADAGAFVGDTLQSFLECSSGRFRRYFAFEPDGGSFAELLAVIGSQTRRITAIQAGLAERTSRARFQGTQGASSRLLTSAELGGEAVQVVALDDYFKRRRPPTIVKMDIEGSEAAALRGARHLLADASPVLAISAYHFPTDLWAIPLLMARLMPGSAFYLRHYTREVDDTVCYAVPSGKL